MRPRKLSSFLITSLVIAALTVAIAPPGWAATYKVFYSFSGGSDGGGLYSGVVIDAQGNLYGGTIGGGTGGGTVYRLKHDRDGSWTKSVIRNLDFGTDGGEPNGGMVFDTSGNLYGTTHDGGPQQVGTVFQLVPNPGKDWNLNVLNDIGSTAGLTIDPAESLYGFGVGAFQLSPSPDGWIYQQIYDFGKQHDPGTFYAAMILDAAGNLYGSSFGGGNGPPYCLTVLVGVALAAPCLNCILMPVVPGQNTYCISSLLLRRTGSTPSAEW